MSRPNRVYPCAPNEQGHVFLVVHMYICVHEFIYMYKVENCVHRVSLLPIRIAINLL